MTISVPVCGTSWSEILKLVYFAWLRERLGRSEEVVELPDGTDTVADLIHWLKGRDEQFGAALEHDEIIQIAINQQHVPNRDTSLKGANEVALFPPMTGG